MADDATIKGKTWFERDYPVLRAVAELLEASDFSQTTADEVAQKVELPKRDAVKSLERLGTKYVTLADVGSLNHRDYFVTGLTADGLVAAEEWPQPDDIAVRLVAALEKALEEAPQGSAKAGKLQQALHALQELGVGASGNVLGQALSVALGLAG